MTFANRKVIVTGASSGIGWSLAKELARRGAHVGLTARRAELLDKLADEIKASGGTAFTASADAADRAGTAAAMHDLMAKLGGVDVLVANAGLGKPTLVEPLNVADLEAMYRVNVFGVIYAVEAVLPHMLERKAGHLAAVSSMAAYKGLPGESGYSSTKAAVNNFMEGMRILLRDRGIDVTTICPGFIATPMTAHNNFKMPFLLTADQAAVRMANALARRKKVYNFPKRMGALMWLTGWLPDWVVARAMAKYNEDPPMG